MNLEKVERRFSVRKLLFAIFIVALGLGAFAQTSYQFANWEELSAETKVIWLQWWIEDYEYAVFGVSIFKGETLDLVLFHIEVFTYEERIGSMSIGLTPEKVKEILAGEREFALYGYLQDQDWSFVYLCGAGAPQC